MVLSVVSMMRLALKENPQLLTAVLVSSVLRQTPAVTNTDICIFLYHELYLIIYIRKQKTPTFSSVLIDRFHFMVGMNVGVSVLVLLSLGEKYCSGKLYCQKQPQTPKNTNHPGIHFLNVVHLTLR